ncbi:MAG: hypothetical protein AAB853_00870, partial [Patescibacteria group bacterium]
MSACVAILDDEAHRASQGKEAREGETAETYQKKQERLGGFLREDAEIRRERKESIWMGSREGRESLLTRLKREDDVVFQYLRRGLETGGWISELHLSRGEEYLCTRITLEEMYLLYDEIASGRLSPQEPESLLHHVRSTFLDVIRRKSHGVSLRQKAAQGVIEGSNPLFEAQSLERVIQGKLANKQKPTSSEVNEFLLLVAWVEGSGIHYELPKEERASLQLLAERGVAEFEQEAELRREALTPVAESKNVRHFVRDFAEEAVKNKTRGELAGELIHRLTIARDPLEEKELVTNILATGDPNALIPALCAIQEEQRIFLDPERRKRHPYSEASILHEAAESAYIAKLIAIREKYGWDTKIAERLKDKLDREYEAGNEQRTMILTSELSRWETLVLRALETELRLRARELREEYEQRLREIEAEENLRNVQNLDENTFSEERR